MPSPSKGPLPRHEICRLEPVERRECVPPGEYVLVDRRAADVLALVRVWKSAPVRVLRAAIRDMLRPRAA